MPAKAVDLEQKLFAQSLVDAEEMIALSIETADFETLKDYEFRLSRQLGQVPVFDGLGLMCAFAAQSLLNITLDIKLPPARAVKAYDGNRRDFVAYMKDCAKYTGVRFKVQLPRSLARR
ncbi:hypothetical protein [Chelatococcus caeni]|nr:hypothetical protein [Chelatococcus caeni]